MKTLKSILTAVLAVAMLCSCSENAPAQSEPPQVIETTANSNNASEPKESEIDIIRRNHGFKDDEILKDIPEEGYPIILIGIPEKITCGEDNGRIIDSVDERIKVNYSFRVIDNVSDHDSVSEYLTIQSNMGNIFELGKEYVINPSHHYSTLWNSYSISESDQVVSRCLLSESDIETARKTLVERKKTREELLKELAVSFKDGSAEFAFFPIENASLDPEFISSPYIFAVELTVDAKSKDEWIPDEQVVIDIDYNVETAKILKGEEYAERLTGWFRINRDVEVGKTYIVMMRAHGWPQDRVLLPAARNGAVIGQDDPDYEKYKAALSGNN